MVGDTASGTEQAGLVRTGSGGRNSAALTSLAILKVEDDQHRRDYIELFVPIIVEALRLMARPVGVPEIQTLVVDRFGLQIPQGAIRTIAGRAVHNGLASRDHHAFQLTDEAKRDSSFPELRARAVQQEHQAVALLRDYAQRERGVSWTDEEAEAALLSYLSARSIPLLEGSVSGSVSPPQGTIVNSEFIVAAFLVHLWENDPDGFACVDTVLKGHLLANVLFFPEIGQIRRRLDNVDVFVDTPLVLRLLGAHGAEAQAAIRELLEMLYALGTSLKCFRHTFDEILNVLDATGRTMRSQGAIRAEYSSLLQALLEGGRTPSDVEVMSATLARTLRDLRVEVIDRPPYAPTVTVDEVELERVLYDTVGYRREETMQRDLDSLAAIHRLRAGDAKPTVESAQALFVTTNPRLVLAARKFFFNHHKRPGIPVALADHQLATLAWLKQPSRSPELHRRFVIADSYAALNPPTPIWKAYLDEVARLENAGEISEDDYFLLRFSRSAKTTLMDRTGGRPQGVSAPVVREVLANVKASIRSESEAVARGALDVSAEAQATVNAVTSKSQSDALFRQMRYAHWGSVVARWLGRVATGVALLGLAVAAVGAATTQLVDSPWNALVAALAGVLILYILAAVLNVGLASPLRGLARRWEVGVARRVEGGLEKQFEPPPTSNAGDREP